MPISNPRVMVVGAGPAGCAAAIVLARRGCAVILLERDRAAREVVCGEFLGPDAAAALTTLGLDARALGAAPITALRLAAGRRSARVALPFAGWGLPRATLDAALRDRARAAGATLIHATAQGAEPAAGFWRVRTDSGSLVAENLLLATGKHTLRGHAREGAPRGAVGLKLHLADIDLPPEIALLPFAGGYAGLQPLPGGGANLCAAVRDVPSDAAALIARVAAGSDHAARVLRDARPAWPRPLAVAGVPYGWRHRSSRTRPRLFRLGDQASVIPSLAGDGVAMALLSGIAAAEAILAGCGAPAFHAAWSRRVAVPMRWAGAAALALRIAPGWSAGALARVPAFGPILANATRTPLPTAKE